MVVADFEEFCGAFCEAASITPPQLEADRNGALAFTVLMRGVSVTTLHVRQRPDAAYVMAELGLVPDYRAVDAWRGMLEANLAWLGRDAPIFSCSPESGEPVLYKEISLDGAGTRDGYEQIDGMVDLAGRWRDDLLGHRPFDALVCLPGARFQPPNDPATGAFDELLRSLRATRDGHACMAAQEPCGSFSLTVAGRDVHVRSAPHGAAESAVAVVNLGVAHTHQEQQALAGMLKANFAWMTRMNSPACSRDPGTGELLVHSAYPLADMDGDLFLERLREFVRMVDWQCLFAAPSTTYPGGNSNG